MFELNVNGKLVQCETDKKLLSFLRDDLKMAAAKVPVERVPFW